MRGRPSQHSETLVEYVAVRLTPADIKDPGAATERRCGCEHSLLSYERGPFPRRT